MAIRGGGGGTFGTGLRLFSLIFRVWGVISITFILIILSSFSALTESVKQGNITPFIKRMGGELLNHDNALYTHAKNIQDSGGLKINIEGKPSGIVSWFKYIWAAIKSLAGIALNLWYFYAFGFLLFKFAGIFITNNTSAAASNIFIAIAGLAILQIFANFIIIDETLITKGEDLIEPENKFIPFQGLVEALKTIPLIFNPIYGEPQIETLNDDFIIITNGG